MLNIHPKYRAPIVLKNDGVRPGTGLRQAQPEREKSVQPERERSLLSRSGRGRFRTKEVWTLVKRRATHPAMQAHPIRPFALSLSKGKGFHTKPRSVASTATCTRELRLSLRRVC